MPTVGDIMSRDLLIIDGGTPLADAARRMHERHVGAVLVVEPDRLVGILTERDVLRSVALGAAAGATVAEWMTRHPEAIEPSDTPAHAAMLMIHGGFRHLPVLDGDELVGIVSIRDVMRVTLDDESPRGV